MKTIVLALALFVSACGTEVVDRPGICFTDGALFWRPCDTVTDSTCTVRVLDRTEIRPLTETVSCADCYYENKSAIGDCR